MLPLISMTPDQHLINKLTKSRRIISSEVASPYSGRLFPPMLEAEVQQEFERREELLNNMHEAEAREAGVEVELTTKTEIIQRRIQVLTEMLAAEQPSDDSKADNIAEGKARDAIEALNEADALFVTC